MDQRTVLRRLLRLDLVATARKLGFTTRSADYLKQSEILSALAALDAVSAECDDFERQVAVLISALLWTYAPTETRDAVRQVITPILSKLGLAPSVRLIDSSLKESGIYSETASYFDKLRVVANDASHEIEVAGRTFLLTEYQARLWESLDQHGLVGISAPTSAGKSFILYLKIVDLLSQGASRVVYIVPTLSLIGQVTVDLSRLFREFGLDDVQILNVAEGPTERFVYVVTQERALSLFSPDTEIARIDLLVVDEIQNIERVANEGADRSKVLYDVLNDVRNDLDVQKIILSGPRLRNISNLGFEIFGEISHEEVSESSPVLSLTYSVSKEKNECFLNQYSTVFSEPLQISVENSEMIQGLGGSLYNERFNSYLNHVLMRQQDSVNIIFSPTAKQARNSAKAFFECCAGEAGVVSIAELSELAAYVRETVHVHYDLAGYLERGIAYHTGKIPAHVRRTLELASAEGLVRNVFCTTTLMQGVNLPANNVIVRNPNLFTRRRSGGGNVQLTAYEFANLRGRAGRLLVDFVGRTIVLDEGAFLGDDDTGETQDLFQDEYKEIRVGYGTVFAEHEEEITDALRHSERIQDGTPKHILTHIRFTLLKHGEEGVRRLENVGINLDSGTATAVINDLQGLNLPRDWCLRNRYWDPVDLAFLKEEYGTGVPQLPRSVWESGLARVLFEAARAMQTRFPYYFDRYLGSVNEKFLWAIVMSAQSWVREEPLVDILVGRFSETQYDGIDEDIDNEVEKLYGKVAWGLPMLLKPLVDLDERGGALTAALEHGVYSPVARFLLDRGVPRETAIKIGRLSGITEHEEVPDALDWARLYGRLKYWERRHVEHLAR